MHAVLAGLTIVAVVGVATAGPAAAATDEDQVRAILNGMNSSYNRSDFAGFAAHLCADMLKPADFRTGWYASRKSDGPTEIVINSIQVTGRNAVANVQFQAANQLHTKTLDVEFLRDGSDWKACRYDAGRSL